jgi:hypothetical protein
MPYIAGMPSKNKNPPRRDLVATRARQAKQATEGEKARADYEALQQATLDKTAKLRAKRLAREAKKDDAA